MSSYHLQLKIEISRFVLNLAGTSGDDSSALREGPLEKVIGGQPRSRPFSSYHPLTWIKACLWLICDALDILFKFSLFLKILASDCLVICKMLFSLKITRLMWSRDWPRPKMRDIRLRKLEDLNVLEILRFIFQNLNLTLVYVVLNGDSEDILCFSHYFLFLSSPSPSPINIRCYGDQKNKSIKPQSIL